MTSFVGLIGHGLKHSISPLFQQAAFDHLGLDIRYEAWETEPSELAKVLEKVRGPSILGANVTVPHKEAVVSFMDEFDDLALEIGAVNTIVNRGGRLKGYNTDAGGFLRALGREGGFDPAGKGAVLLGAGGVARAASFALARAGVKSLVITDIIEEKAHELVSDLERSLAERGKPVPEITALSPLSETRVYMRKSQTEFGRVLRKLRLAAGYSQAGLAEFAGISSSYVSRLETGQRMPTPRVIRTLSPLLGVTPSYLLRAIGMLEMDLVKVLSGCDLLVNCTPVGMKHSADEGELPLEALLIPKRALVYDVVYNPIETPLLADAKRAGASTLGGLAMLVYQGAAAFELWTGQEAPVDIMMEVATKALEQK